MRGNTVFYGGQIINSLIFLLVIFYGFANAAYPIRMIANRKGKLYLDRDNFRQGYEILNQAVLGSISRIKNRKLILLNHPDNLLYQYKYVVRIYIEPSMFGLLIYSNGTFQRLLPDTTYSTSLLHIRYVDRGTNKIQNRHLKNLNYFSLFFNESISPKSFFLPVASLF